jgi:RNA polymerase sigma-70 factor (ECF subfamily)
VQEQATDCADRAALAQLLPELRAFARFLAGTRAEADDLVQEAVLRALHGMGARPPAVPLKAWCLGIIRNVFQETLRAHRRHARLSLEPAATPALAEQEMPQRMRELERALAALPPRLREALVLVGGQGLSLAEAAEVCGVPLGTLKARVSRARAQLQASLGPVIG